LARIIRFGPFELDVQTAELWKHGVKLRLHEQPFRILVMLLNQPGEVVSREDLRKALWPNDTVVEFEHSINSAIQRLREALGDSAENARYVETLPRRGYRFIGTLEPEPDAGPPPAAVPEVDPSNLSGATFGHFRMLEKLGSGGMGVVYRADDLKLGRQVAVKFLRLPVAKASPEMRERFRREARAASALNHPHICTIHGVEDFAGQPMIVTELVEGETLAARLARGALPHGEALALGIQIAGALGEAHRKGIVHRDLKPANLMLTKSGAKVLDFGLAKLTERVSGEDEATRTIAVAETAEGKIVGTFAYMSPEQASGKPLDPRSDLFSFGAVLYEMIGGRRAFTGDSAVTTLAAVIHGEPAPLRQLAPSTPPHLETVVRSCLRKNREERYPSADALLADLEACRSEMSASGSGMRLPLSRRQLIFAGAGGVAVAAAAAVATRLTWAPPGAAKLRTFAVMLIENLTGDPSLDWMDRGLCELLTTALAQSRALAVLSTEVLRSAAAHRFRHNARLTVEHARDVARDTRAELYASGSLFKLGSGFRLSLRAQETESGRLVYTGAVDGADAQALFGMTDQAAAAMLAQIAPRSQARPDSAGGLTSNLEALKAYTEAGIYNDQFLMDQANRQIYRAVELDPEFAMAQARLAEISDTILNPAVGRAAAARAVAISRRRPLPVAHVRYMQALALGLDGRLEESLKVLEAARKESPQDWAICTSLSEAYWMLGRFREATSNWEEAVRLDPNAARTYLDGAYTYAESGDLPKALQFVERYASLMPPNTWNVAVTRGDAFACNEHFDEALEQYRIGAKIQPTNQLGRLLALLGLIEEAEAYIESLPEGRRPRLYCDIQTRKGNLDGALASYAEFMRRVTNQTCWCHWPNTWNAGNLLLEQGDAQQALTLGKRLPNPWAPGLRGAAHLILGDEGAAQADFAELRKGITPIVGDFMARTTESLWRVKAASCLGRHGEVADLCSRLTRFRNGARWAYSLDLVRALLSLGRLADAEAELTWLTRMLLDIGGGNDTGMQFSMLTYLLARYHLGQVRERTGRRTEAAERYRLFLSSFEHSSAKLPQIAEARAALKRL
jgi:DNA-binding winged helix-turn-helix (wHTH) protein/tetratricopeptide (TPR) repeat protein